MKKEKDTIRFSVSLPANLLKELDKRIVSKGYASRSEFVRDLIREQMIEDKWRASKGTVVGVLTISYDHHQPGLPQKIMDVQHNRYINILCTTHVHLDHHTCLEAIIMRGSAPEIEKLKIQIGGLRGVKFAKLSKASKLPL